MAAAAEAAEASDDPIIDDFDELVNMGPATLERWLETDESKSVGVSSGGSSESVGHASGRHIVKILRKKKSEYTDADVAHMHKVVAYIKRHMAQRPEGDTSQTRWAYSLKNWGHDPAKK